MSLVWAIIGVLLIIFELVTNTFVFCFFGVGAIIVAITIWLGLTPEINGQLIVFSIASILLMFLLKKTAKEIFAGHNDLKPDYLGQKVKVIKEIPIGGEGAVRYRGSDWLAVSDSTNTIKEGMFVEIIGIEGIVLKVKPIS